MEEILHHLEYITPVVDRKYWDIYHINWLAGFLPSTIDLHSLGARSCQPFISWAVFFLVTAVSVRWSFQLRMKTRWQIFCMILWHVQHGYPFLSAIYLVIYLILDPKKTSRHNSCGERCLIGIFLGSSHTFSAGGPGCLGDDGFLPPPQKKTPEIFRLAVGEHGRFWFFSPNLNFL